MSQQRTHEEIRADYVQKMGQDLGELFDALSHELTLLHWRWNQYRILFVEPHENDPAHQARIALLNYTASFFFYILQGAFFEATLLGIARLVGPPRSVGKDTLTLRRLPPFLTGQVQVDISALIGQADEMAQFAVDWRHRHLAHRGLDLALGKSALPLSSATAQQVDGALSALAKVLNAVERHYFPGTHTAYDWVVAPGDAEGLLFAMMENQLRQEERQQRWAQQAGIAKLASDDNRD
jgi:hypothetical protein